ncbi:MAG: tRNA (N(6)-L-threonylcarbamoyladenosine(37)-C(2))-methylthiotransferase MtaB [Clostridia bacterium]|nr:tRNA (N(6)-L-threonylcarbamoyladenosine(37)-C(2))-methylthiotransferase MtaB [Clostridia bacterium]
MKTVAFHTLGCKVNQYDSEAMLELFEKAGYAPGKFNEKCDVYVVNTCTVTGTGDKKSLQAVRRAQRLNPEAAVIVCGCLAQRDGEKLLRETGAQVVIGNARRNEVVALLEKALAENTAICAVTDVTRAAYEPLFITRHEGKTRAVLKIQEGCDRFCAYCIIPYVRGGIRSRAVEDVVKEAACLAESGYREVVLTGIHLTSYGRDFKDGTTLLTVIKALHDIDGVERIRLGSLEPVIANEEFACALSKLPKVCPQFHLALQSGCDTVLKRMRRRYDTAAYRESVLALRKYFPDCALTTDVLCGFPGETAEEHGQTLAFCREMGFARMHVFPYSEREGTLAATMPDPVPRHVREDRARELIRLGDGMAESYRRSQLGSVRSVLFETEKNGKSFGYTMEYMHCEAPGDLIGKTLNVHLTGLTEEGFSGEIC